MVKREGESGELIRSDVQFSTEIYEDERNVQRYRDEQRCSDIFGDVKIFLEIFRDGQKCTKKMQSSQRIWCRTGPASDIGPSAGEADICAHVST